MENIKKISEDTAFQWENHWWNIIYRGNLIGTIERSQEEQWKVSIELMDAQYFEKNMNLQNDIRTFMKLMTQKGIVLQEDIHNAIKR